MVAPNLTLHAPRCELPPRAQRAPHTRGTARLPFHVPRVNTEWARQREQRILAHACRVASELRRHSRRPLPGETTNGHRQAVWCVELGRPFESLTLAARFVGRAPSNILQALRFRVRCGGYHWERYVAPGTESGAPRETENRSAAPDVTAQSGVMNTSVDNAEVPTCDWEAVIGALAADGDGPPEMPASVVARDALPCPEGDGGGDAHV